VFTFIFAACFQINNMLKFHLVTTFTAATVTLGECFSVDMFSRLNAPEVRKSTVSYSTLGLPAASGVRVDPTTGSLFGTITTADALAAQPLKVTVIASDSVTGTVLVQTVHLQVVGS
jgi:hypothetical protein